MTVLFVIPGESTGSSMVFARRQAEALASRGVRVEPFYLRSRTSPGILWSEVRRFRRVCATLQPDLIHAHFGTVTAMFAVLASFRIPVVITYRGSDLNYVPSSGGPRAYVGRLLSQLAALGASRIVCVSRKLRDQLWWRRDIVTILPSGVDVSVFSPIPRAEARRQLGWAHDHPVILFNAGHDARNKRLDMAQAAAAIVRKTIPEARLEILAGDISPEAVPVLMNAADCLLVTSDAEGSPTVVQEAIATNLPIVSVDVGDVMERVRDVAETSIASRDPRVLAWALVRTLERRSRSNGRRVVRDIDAARIADEHCHLYLETVSPKKVIAWNTTLSSLR